MPSSLLSVLLGLLPGRGGRTPVGRRGSPLASSSKLLASGGLFGRGRPRGMVVLLGRRLPSAAFGVQGMDTPLASWKVLASGVVCVRPLPPPTVVGGGPASGRILVTAVAVPGGA